MILALRLWVTASRAVVGGVTEAWDRRTNFRKAVLSPWDPRVEQVFLYALAEAADKYGVTLHITTLVPSHHHTQGTVSEANADLFLARLHQPISCALNNLLGKRGYDPMDQIWDNAQPSRIQLVGVAAMMEQLVYDKVQNAAAGLVNRPEDWPGFSFNWDLWRPGRVVRVYLPEFYYDGRYHKPYYDIDFRPQKELLRFFGGDINRLIFAMKKLERLALQHIRRARKGQRVRGPKAVLNMHPYDEPRTQREARGQTIPTFKLGSGGGPERQALRIRCCQEVTAFRQQSRDAFARHKAGEANVVFPYGTGKMARLHNVQVEPQPHPDAILYTPNAWDDDGDDAVHDALGHVRELMEERLAQLSGDNEVYEARSAAEGDRAASGSDSVDRTAITTVDANAAPPPQATDKVVIQTLRGNRRTDPERPPRRIIVLRTRFEQSGRRASDPPGE